MDLKDSRSLLPQLPLPILLPLLQDLLVLVVFGNIGTPGSLRTILVLLEVLFLENLVTIRAPAATTLVPRPWRSPGTTRLAGATGTMRQHGNGGTVAPLTASMLWPCRPSIPGSWKGVFGTCLSHAPVVTTATPGTCLQPLGGTLEPGHGPADPIRGPGAIIWHLTSGTWPGRTWSPARSLTTTKDGSSQSHGATGMHYGPARCGLADWGHDWYFKAGPYYDPCKAPNLQVYPERGLYHEPPVGPPVPVAAPAVPVGPVAAPAVPVGPVAALAGPDTDDSGDSGSAVSVASSTDTATGDGIGQVTYLVREGPGPIVAGRINYLVREAILQNGIPMVIPRPLQPPPAAPAAPAAEPEAGPGASQGLFSGFIAANPGLDLPWDNFALQDAPMEPAVPEMPVEPEVPVQPQELAPIQEEPVEPVVPEFGPCASEPSESRRVLYIGEPSESGASASGS